MSQSQNNSTRSRSTSPPVAHEQTVHDVPSASTRAEMAQAFKDLARGEQQAAAIEANLASLESKLDALLASIEAGGGTVVDGNKDEKFNKELSSEEK